MGRTKGLWAGIVTGAILATTPATFAEEDPNATGLIEGARWHHVEINSTDPAASAAYYEKHFDAYVTDFPGSDAAIRAQHVYLLFNEVDEPASTALNTAIMHIGWGAPDPHRAFERQKDLGADFSVPIRDISGSFSDLPYGSFYFMYIRSPDGTIIELNTSHTNDFGHIHMYAADPVATGDWWIRYFGVTGRPLSTADDYETEMTNGLSGRPGERSSHMFDQVNMIIYPDFGARRSKDWVGDELQTTRGTVNDHIGISVADLDAALALFRADGVTILEEASEMSEGVRHAFIEGPDAVVIELLELS
ncbi:MAG: hypothetical protein CMK09_03700 [Ponticaulis sp.]|nr:hypothetical protein [Ponticaulis sp.]|tara:strand:+ start:313 stop:1230 length:918 start_codon:yes stop_codon:yes gene_type:complete